YYYSLGISGQAEKTPLKATITGTLQGDGFVVDLLHYQSRPGLYVTGNLYRPAYTQPGSKQPAVFYVCGHFAHGRDGNKAPYQAHGIWLAKHGYICLIVDTLQLSEIAATHHGTYNLQRWSWHSRGYSPAGVEAWNGIRGIDYLISRDDVDPHKIAVTGISGGGAATFWIAAADERARVAVPVSGMADLEAYVPNRVINGHCDCMFVYNTFQWPWTRIAALIAPRPLLFINSDHDHIFPMDANERISNRLERLYSLYGAGDQIDTVVSVGGHAYRKDIRQAAYRFLNAHLDGNSAPITDSEQDLVSEEHPPRNFPISPAALRVFPADLPADQLNTKIDEHFIPVANVAVPEAGHFTEWKKSLIDELRRVTFGYFPAAIPAAKKLGDVGQTGERLQSEDSIEFRLNFPSGQPPASQTSAIKKVLLVLLNEGESGSTPDWVKGVAVDGQLVVLCEPRGIGATRWTRKNPPNYVERSHALLGRTVDTGRVWDVIAASKYLSARFASESAKPTIQVAGKGSAAILAAYAGVLEDQIAGVTLVSSRITHLDNEAPQFLNVLRVCDVPDALGLLAPRPVTIISGDAAAFAKTARIYEAAGNKEKLVFGPVRP
ncbi:MAG: Acetyl xylan esterase, partial [Planctomycetaceae bacterium]|nr:Acetyl xylan esterase [Planctomycetaceae bacterium]